jgi:hypothetical protein
VIWWVMIGIAVMLLVEPFYWGAICFGVAIGAGLRVNQRRRR